ncbi:choline/ethanolamine kinase-like isoform X2 [Brevipalpus obovatus]
MVIMKDTAFTICRKFLTGSWKKISLNEMQFQRVSGGLTNVLFKCSLPQHLVSNDEPSQVLLRIYGQLKTDQDSVQEKENKVTESLIFMLLSERNLGPKLHGIFPGGRLEEFIPAQSLNVLDLRDAKLSSTIARKLAHIHTLDVPITKEPTWLPEQMLEWCKVVQQYDLSMVKEESRLIARNLINIDFESELRWLQKFLLRCKSPVVFSHNDLHEGNILIPDSKSPNMNGRMRKLSSTCRSGKEQIIFIDFEFCSYNYRGYDFANHFCEWAVDYTYPNHPYFSLKWGELPSEQEKRFFIREYLSALDENRKNPEIDNEEHILNEANHFMLASHLFWTLWCINMSTTSEIAFGYLEYGAERYNRYLRDKALFLQNPSCDLDNL